MLELIVTVLIGCVIGWLAGKIFSGSGNGLIVNILVGLAGSWLGNKLLSSILPNGVVWGYVGAVIGAIIILWVISLIRGRK